MRPTSYSTHPGLHYQQVQLFRHLSLVLCRLCERIAWNELDPSERRRLRRVIAGLSAALNTTKAELRLPSDSKKNGTTKAALRKR